MNAPQVLPSIFASLTEHIHRIRLLKCIEPTAWVITEGELVLFNSQQSRQRIEDCEFWIHQQSTIGCLCYVVAIQTDLKMHDHTLIQLYDGTKFSHTLFQPHNPALKKSWWVEPWQLDHLLT